MRWAESPTYSRLTAPLRVAWSNSWLFPSFSFGLLAAMQESYERVMSSPGNLLRPWAMDPQRDGTITCPSCLGVADLWPDDGEFVCRRCGARTPAPAGVRGT